jgi:GT2 family glycosyltransferase
MPTPRLTSVLIPLYRGRATIRACLDSLLSQKGAHIEILLLDNGCPENTGEWAGWRLSQQDAVEWRLLEERHNIGFAAGINRLYAESAGDLVCFMNQDVTLEPDHLRLLADALETHRDERWAGVCGTLLRATGDRTRVIDTTGHVIFRDRIVRNRGAGRPLDAEGSSPYPAGEVFGLSAACSLYAREALEAVREEEGPFDPDFFAYFEDIDLDYRLRRGGWRMGYVPEALGAHVLAGSGGRKELGIRIRAYGNRRRIMWKHESISSLLPDLGPILMQEVYGWTKALLTDPAAWLVGPWVFYTSLPAVLKRRKRLDETLGVGRCWIRKWLRPEVERWSERS